MEQSRQLSEIWKENIITQPNFIENELSELDPEDKGDHYKLRCPECDDPKTKAFLYKESDVINCNHQNSCGANTPVLEYLHTLSGRGSSFPSGNDYIREIKHWADQYGVKLNEKHIQERQERHEKVSRIQDTLKKFWKSIESLSNPEGEKVITDRGLSQVREKYRIYTNHKEVVSKLKETGGTRDDFAVLVDLGLIPQYYENPTDGYQHYWNNRLLGCNVGRSGNIVGFWGRSLNDAKQKYLKSKSHEALNSSFVPYNAGNIRGETIILVEGFLDVDTLLVCGYQNVLALETKTITQHHQNVLNNKKRVIIFPDNDDKGHEGVITFMEKYKNADFDTFVVDTDLMDEDDDPNKVYVKYGEYRVKELLDSKNLISGHAFVAKSKVKSYRGEEWSDIAKQDCYKDIAKYAKEITNEDQANLVYNTLIPLLQNEGVAVRDVIENLKERQTKEIFQKRVEIYTASALDKLKNGSLEEAFNDHKKINELITQHQNPFKEISPYTLTDLVLDLENSPIGLKTGYKALDEMISIQPETISLIGGRPSHGKTTFMLNMFLNVIELYPDKKFYFFSYEETCQQIALKLINIMSGLVINEKKNLQQLHGVIKGGYCDYRQVNEAKVKFHDLTQSERLVIIGEPLLVQNLSTTVSHLSSKKAVGAVFVDYIQKIKTKEKFNTRQLELQKTSEIILETAKSCSVPIVLGAQLGRDSNSRDKVRLDNLRECGDLEQDANIVLGLFNPSMEKAQNEDNPLTDRTVDITVTPLKNRNGMVNKPVDLVFDRPILKICDK